MENKETEWFRLRDEVIAEWGFDDNDLDDESNEGFSYKRINLRPKKSI